jgi:hypothetical protein
MNPVNSVGPTDLVDICLQVQRASRLDRLGKILTNPTNLVKIIFGRWGGVASQIPQTVA